LVDSVESMMMHGLANPKSIFSVGYFIFSEELIILKKIV